MRYSSNFTSVIQNLHNNYRISNGFFWRVQDKLALKKCPRIFKGSKKKKRYLKTRKDKTQVGNVKLI